MSNLIACINCSFTAITRVQIPSGTPIESAAYRECSDLVWAQMGTKCSATCAAERVEPCVYASFRANLVGTNGHKPLADEGYFFRVSLRTKRRTTFV